MYTIKRTDRLTELAKVAASWNRLVEQSPQLVPTSSYAWISSYLEHRLKDSERWVCFFAYRGRELAGVLPLVIAPVGIGPVRKQSLRLPGDRHTISADLVCSSEDGEEIVEALIGRVFEDYPEAPYLALSRIPDGSVVLGWLRDGARKPLHTIKWDGDGACLSTTGSHHAYMAGLSARFRRNQRYYRKQLAKLPGYSQQMLAGVNATPSHLDSFIQVEAANWKGQAGTAILASESLRQFYATLVDRLHKCGWLRWDFIEVEGHPIAASLAIQLGARQVVWKIAYDVEYAQLSAGTIILDSVVRRAFEDPQVEELDLLSDYPYISKWRVAMRPYYNVRLYRRGPLALFFYYVPSRLGIGLRRLPLVRGTWNYLKRRIARMKT